MSAEMVKATLNGEYTMILPKHRADRPEWYTAEGWEKKRLMALHNEIQYRVSQGTAPVVYDVGAEEGEMPALYQMWGARVVLFEPNPKVWPNIKAIWEANELEMPLATFEGFASNRTDADAWKAARSGEWPVHASEEVVGNHGFKELYLEGDNYPQIQIDSMAERIDPPTIITFDCEGSDWEVMKGAEQTLRQHKPAIFASIHPEFMFHQFGQYSYDFRRWLKDFGYDETILDYQHELHAMYVPREVV